LNAYAIYYGWLTEDAQGEPNAAAHRLAAARFPLLIAHYWTAQPARHCNLSRQVLALMHGAGTSVHAYVPTGWSDAPLARVTQQALDCLAGGVDGIFFDEADALVRSERIAYYATLAQLAWNRGRTVIVNPGVARCGEALMAVADIVMVEHRWRSLGFESGWVRRYPAARFMGVSGNEENAMGYFVDERRAIEDTQEAWRAGIGWHASTDRYTGLADWLERYAEAVGCARYRDSRDTPRT
jgi:hypothetical protein